MAGRKKSSRMSPSKLGDQTYPNRTSREGDWKIPKKRGPEKYGRVAFTTTSDTKEVNNQVTDSLKSKEGRMRQPCVGEAGVTEQLGHKNFG